MIELIKMPLLYDGDLTVLMERINILKSHLGMNRKDVAKVSTVAMELANSALLHQTVAYFSLSIITDSITPIFVIMLDINTVSKNSTTIEEYFRRKMNWLKNFIISYNFHVDMNNIRIECRLTSSESLRIPRHSEITHLLNMLGNAEANSFTRQSKEDLIKDLMQRSEKLRQMIELDQMKTQFLANMSHELRTPLNSIIGFAEMLEDGIIGELNDEQLDVIRDILKSARHLLQLINQILDLSKIAAGKMKLHKTTLDINVLVKDVLGQLQPLLSSKGLRAELNVNSNDTEIFADEIRIKQVLFNLLSNAIKFSHNNSKIEINISKNKNELLIEVKDYGIGIAKDNQQIIFEEFRQVDNSHTRAYQGTGLGLALCKKLIELHGGKIWVESEYGKGSSFFFTIPNVTEIA